MLIADAFFSLHDRLLIALFGCLVHLLLMRESVLRRIRFLLPQTIISPLFEVLEKRLNRHQRNALALRIRGALCGLLLIVACIVIGLGLGFLAQKLPYAELVEIALLATALQVRGALDASWSILSSLKNRRPLTHAALAALAHPAALMQDPYGVARAAIESLHTRFCIQFVSPVFWYILLGIPGLLLCVSITAAEHFLKARGHHGAHFGRFARAVFYTIHYIPARICGVLLVISAIFIPSCRPIHCVFGMLVQSVKIRATPYGWTLGALSGSLSLALAGPKSHYLLLQETPWIGTGSARPDARDLARALFLFGIALQLTLLSIALALYLLKPSLY